MSLARMASMPGYSKPELTDEHQLVCEGAFHPMVAAVSDDTYVPVRSLAVRLHRRPRPTLTVNRELLQNDVNMSATHGHTKVITGPNMGGKSSMVRTLALIVLMAQIGSYGASCAARLLMAVRSADTRSGASLQFPRPRSSSACTTRSTRACPCRPVLQRRALIVTYASSSQPHGRV